MGIVLRNALTWVLTQYRPHARSVTLTGGMQVLANSGEESRRG